MGTPVSALAQTLSSAGSAASGAGGLIGSISSLLPTTQTGKYHNTATASSDTLNTQAELGSTSSKGTEKTKGAKDTKNITDNIGTEKTSATQSQTGTQSGVQSFSGAENTTTTQTMLTDPAAMRIVNLMLQGDGGIPGLQQIVSGERNAGVFNSSTNELLLNNLAATISGEVARLSAPTVSKENLGSSSTTSNQSNQSTAETISTVLNNLSQIASGKERTEGTNTIESTVLNALMGLGTQSTDQTSESSGTSKTKTSKFPSAIGFIVFGLMGATMNDPVFAGSTKFAREELTRSEKADYCRFSKRLVIHLKQTPITEYTAILEGLKESYVVPIIEAHKKGELERAKNLFHQMVRSV